MSPRRELMLAVLGCAGGAGVALLAASRTWLVEASVRAAPLPPVSMDRSGGSLVPALPALALVALAGAGALLATTGRARMLLAMLLGAVGLAMSVVVLPAASRHGVQLGWLGLAAMAGLVVAGVGLFALRRGAVWPGLGARYQRRVGEGELGRADGEAHPGRLPDARLWDAIDRGEDPTQH